MLMKISKICLGTLLLNTFLYSVENTPSPKLDPLKDWWKKGSYEYATTDKILTHLEGTGRYSKSNGNDEKEDILVNITGKIRKGHFGASLSYTKKYQDYTFYNDKDDTSPAKTVEDEYKVNFVGAYDINKDFYVNLGYVNSRDITFEVYNQTTMYLGVGYRLLTSDMHRLSVFVAKGSEDISFGTYPQLPSGKSDGYYYQVNYSLKINPIISWTSSYAYLKLDKKNRDTSLLNSRLVIRASENISFLLGYEDEYMAGQSTVNRDTHDKTTYTAVKFEF